MARQPARRSAPWRLLRGFLLACLQLGLLLALLGAGLAYAAYRYYGRDLPDPRRLAAVPPSESTRILARDGTLLYEIADPQLGSRVVVEFDQIPLAFKQATIAVEDASFYENPGVDLRGVLRALYLNYQEGQIVSGGSTITQQLVRNVLLSPEERKSRSFERKLREAILAYRVSREYSKDQILSLYLNEVYYGNQAYGVEAAARSYFGKHVWDLNLAEISMLAGLPQSPTRLNPLDNLGAARARQRVTLELMVKQGYLSATQADTAWAAPLVFSTPQVHIRAPHFAFYVRQLLEERYGPDLLYRGGLIVTTTLDLNLQNEAQRIALARIDELRPRNAHNAAAVLLSPAGEILAMVGSVDYYQPAIDGKVNVTLMPRQPGSSLKPLLYAAALERGWTPATVIWDAPSEFANPGGAPYRPVNYDGNFHGPLRLRMALANSLNIPAVKTLEFVGVPSFVALAHRMGITTLRDPAQYGLPIALGAGEVRLLDLTSVYATLRNAGYRTSPLALLKVTTARGEVLFSQKLADEQGRPLRGEQTLGPRGEQIAYLISDILSDAAARRYMFGANNVMELPDGRPAAVKTGTSDEWRDSWAVGYTADLTVGVWVGNSDNVPMEEIAGANGAGLIWRDLMELYHAGLEARPFERPPDIVELEVCADTGGLASPGCSSNVAERFVAGSEPQSPDVLLQTLRVAGDGSCLAQDYTPPEQAWEASFAVYPAEFREWAVSRGIPQAPTQPCPRPPRLALSTPAPEAWVGSTVVVRGTAGGSYVLEVGAGREPAPEAWQRIAEGGPLEDGVLGVWQAGGLPAGEYSIRLRLIDGGETRVRVRLDGQAPALRLLVPAQGQQFRAGETVLLTASASDNAGQATVEFYVDGVLLASVGPPFQTSWQATPGVHTVGVAAVDQAGNRVSGPVVSVVVR